MSEHGNGIGEHAPEGRTGNLWGMGSCWASVNLIKAVIADTGRNDGGGGRLEDGEWDIARRMEEGEIRGVEERSGARGARVAEHATAFATMLKKTIRTRQDTR
jgi:hypothetical protein